MHKTGNFYSVFWASPESAVFQDNPVKIILMPKSEILWWFLIAPRIKSVFLHLVHTTPLLPTNGASPWTTHPNLYFSKHQSHWTICTSWAFWAFVYDAFSVWNSILSLLTFTTCLRNMSSKRPKNFPNLHSVSIKPFPRTPCFCVS